MAISRTPGQPTTQPVKANVGMPTPQLNPIGSMPPGVTPMMPTPQRPTPGAVQDPGSIGQPAPMGAATPPSADALAAMEMQKQRMFDNAGPGGHYGHDGINEGTAPGSTLSAAMTGGNPIAFPTGGAPAPGGGYDDQISFPTDKVQPGEWSEPAPPGMGPVSKPPVDSRDMMQPYRPGQGKMGSSTGGVSAVNPQAGMYDYNGLKRFEDAAYGQAMQRLNPQLDQQSDQFDQAMVNRGIPVGSEAYQEAKQQLDFNQNDARSSAAFNAMGFGRDTQNQMFGQDATRSGLANSLLQAQMGNKLGYAGLNERGRQFDAGLGEGARQFDDRSNMAWDNQGFGQMMGLENNQFRNRAYNDSRSDYGDSLLMSMLGYGGGQNPQWNADPNQPYGQQLGYGAAQYGNQMGLYGDIFRSPAWGGF